MAKLRPAKFKVAALILTAVGLLVAFILILNEVSFQPSYSIYVGFDNLGRLRVGSLVTINGLHVGKIQKVIFFGPVASADGTRRPLFRVEARIERRFQNAIREDSSFYISVVEPLHEPFLNIVPGTPDHPPLSEGAVVRGVDVPRLDLPAEPPPWILSHLPWLAKIPFAHAAFWMVLLIAYPRSRMVQAIFFWNPWVRRIAGVGYVSLLLLWIPFLRRRLFAPFRDALLADAALDAFHPTEYFAGAEVKDPAGRVRPLREEISTVRGQIVLSGDAGSGKTMFLRDLVQRSTSMMAYLPAAKCAGGVVEALLVKLEGPARDPAFLRALVYCGAIDITIDGLNEVTADTRARISEFTDQFGRGNILLATQPLGDWKIPSRARAYAMLPLKQEAVREFLLSREKTLDGNAPARSEEYEHACTRLLEELTLPDRPKEAREAMLRVLSNPMDLTVVAYMLGQRMDPDLYRLREQQYEWMSAEYEKANMAPFPLAHFAEHVYAMRCEDRFGLDDEELSAEIRALEKHKMVVHRSSKDIKGAERTDYRFRHDKVMDFFLMQAFLGKHRERRLQHLDDPRFRGVYFLLAMRLPLGEAEELERALVECAVDTGDHTISDEVVNLLRQRRSTERKRELAAKVA